MQRTWPTQSDAYKEKFLWTRKVGWELRSLEIQKTTKTTPQHRRQTENSNFAEGSDLNSRRPVSSIGNHERGEEESRPCVYAVSQRSAGPDAERRSLIRPVFYDNKAATLCANPVWKCHPYPGRRVLIHSHLRSFYQSSCSCLVTRRSPRLLSVLRIPSPSSPSSPVAMVWIAFLRESQFFPHVSQSETWFCC